MKKSEHLLFWLIVFIGAFLRFYKLDWGEGFFFHPDEYHIAIAVNRLSFPTQLNPSLFSYGSFTVYLIYLTKLFVETFFSYSNLNVFLIGRFYSAFFSTATIGVVFLLAKKLFKDKLFGYLTASLVALTPGLIQQAHFATPESNLIFFTFLAILFSLHYSNTKSIKSFYFACLSLGVATGIKITALFFAPALFILLFNSRLTKRQFLKRVGNVALGIVIIALTFFLVFPYSVLDYKNFRNSMNYESKVASGEQVVFYTRQFDDTLPLVFQLQKILPFTLGPALLFFGAVGFLVLFYKMSKNILVHKKINWNWLIICISFLAVFLSNSFLYAKWTRFIAPTFPFFAIFGSYLIAKTEPKKVIFTILTLILVITTLFWSLMFFSIYLRNDVRKTATEWIKENLPQNSQILTEQGNTYEVPLSSGFDKISFDFYHLDENPELPQKLTINLESTDYFIIQSRRIYMNHKDSIQFPVTSKFYDALFSGKLGFRKIKEIDSYPSLFNTLIVSDEGAEETWSVFDHPVISIYEKHLPLTQHEYEEILGI